MIARSINTRAPIVTVLVDNVRSTDTDAEIVALASAAIGTANIADARMSRDVNDPTRAVVTLDRVSR